MHTYRYVFLVVALAAMGCGTESDVNDGAGPSTVLEIIPARAALTIHNDQLQTQRFVARLSVDGEPTRVVQASWLLDNAQAGTVDADGLFTPRRVAGGATLRARVGDLTAVAEIVIGIDDTHYGEGVPLDAADRFNSEPLTQNANAAELLYPLDGAVVPMTLKPPRVQWAGGAAGDLYRVRASSGAVEMTSYVLHSGAGFDHASSMDVASWAALRMEAALTGTAVTILVDRWDSAAGLTYRSAVHRLHVSKARLDGAIYYWDLSDGKILRINNQGREDFIPNPPPQPSNGERCVACHTVSKDGRYMAARLWGGNNYGTVFDLTKDLTQDPAPTVLPTDRYQTLFSTFNPEATHVMINPAKRLELIDAATGLPVATAGTALPTDGAANPVWSPDGSLIAYIANHNGPSWALDYTLGDLAVIPAENATTFGPTRVLRAADGLANSWPTFSPNSQWIAYGRGVHSRGRKDNEVYPGSLRLIHREGGQEIVLANANGSGENSHVPNFSPFNEDGYFWLVFYSTRDYGNAQAGTRGTGRRQLWISAISNDPQSGQDPSHVPYWLPDQDVTTHNMTAKWALPPPVVVE